MKRLSLILLAIGLIAMAATTAMGVSSYKSAFLAAYPGKSTTALNSCLLCHTSTSANGGNVNLYGDAYANANYSFTAIEALDSDGDGYSNIAEINANSFPGNAASIPTAGDTTAPTVSTFTVPATSTSLTVSVTAFTATDNVGVTGYMVTSTATAPAAGAAGWSGTAPASYTFAAGTANGAKTLYAWAKDAAGNVSASRSASVTLSVPDTTAPTVSTFTIPATATSLVVSVSAFTATDNVGVTGYLLSESATAPAAGAAGWSGSAPANYSFASAGAKTLYAWAKDAAGNVSTSRSASVTITLPDAVAPTVSSFTIPATSTSLTVSITGFTATDNTGISGYMITESATAPAAGAAGWSGSAPASYTFAAGTANGAKTLYAWAKDAAGNISASRNASVTLNVPDTTAPTVSTFTIPATATSLTVSVSAFSATDNIGVTGYMITESATAPAAGAAGWSGSAPASYTFAAGTANGAKTLYAWAKDAAGNVSAARTAPVTINVPDTTLPTVSTFTIPATASSLSLTITSLVATDNTGVTGYLITESATKPAAGAAGWSVTPQTRYIFTSGGAKTLYAWAKDAAGNVSSGKSASTTITISAQTRVASLGVFLKGAWYQDANSNGIWDGASADTQINNFGSATGAVPVTGDWDGSGTPKAGVFWNGQWFLDMNGNGAWDGDGVDLHIASFGSATGAVPVTGDWDGSGVTRIGVFWNGQWFLDMNGNGAWDGDGVDLHIASFGSAAGAVPVTGDWDGSGTAKVGVFLNGAWYLDLNGNGIWDGESVDRIIANFGAAPGASPVTGDWDGSGTEKVGVFLNGTWYLDMDGNGVWDGEPVDRIIANFGKATGARPVVFR